jgi:hypothetical protein
VAYGDGLLSDDTFRHRLDLLFNAHLIDPVPVIGDLSFRGMRPRAVARLRQRLARICRTAPPSEPTLRLLGLDWAGPQQELVVGRDCGCDVVLSDESVSRHHARLRFRDGGWMLQDLESTNGTLVNGVRVGRCSLRPGDRLTLGTYSLQID